jgi:hypothetical protein
MAERREMAADDELDRDERPTGAVSTAATEQEEPVEPDDSWPQLSPLELSVCLADAAWGSTRPRRSPTT